MKRSRMPRPTKPMRRQGAKARRAAAELRKSKQAAFAQAGGLCQARIPGVCTRIATDAHHVVKRSRGGSHHASNILPTCRACHDWIETHDKEAKRMGLSQRNPWPVTISTSPLANERNDL